MNRVFSDLKDKSSNFSGGRLNIEIRKNIRSYGMSPTQLEQLKKKLILYRKSKIKKYYENKINKNSKNNIERTRGRLILNEIRFNKYEKKRNAIINYLFSKSESNYDKYLNELRNFGLLSGISNFGRLRSEVLTARRNNYMKNK